jgi:transcription antitermination factor NusG
VVVGAAWDCKGTSNSYWGDLDRSRGLFEPMVVSAKDSAGVGMAHVARSGDFLFQLCDGERWFVAQTLSHRELSARFHLGTQGFRTFLPRFHKTVRHARSLREVIAPVFPGYIFVVLNPERDRWRSINGTFGVARLVSACQRPVPVPAGVVEALLSSVDESGLVRFDRGLKPGQSVRVVAGPFAQLLGVLERLDTKGRVQVLLNVMGRQAAVMMDQANLTAA